MQITGIDSVYTLVGQHYDTVELLEVRNKTLAKLSRFDYLIDGEENTEDAGPVQLMFTDGSVLEIELAEDGESVEYFWSNKKEVEEDDKKTDWFRIDLTDNDTFFPLKEKKITDFDKLLFGTIEASLEEMVVAGLGFRFENSMTLIYYNAGDFAKIYLNELPPPFDGVFKLVWKNGKFEEIITKK